MAFAPAETLFDEILEFLASSPSAEQLVNYQPPVALQQRLSELLDKNRSGGLSKAEQQELEEFLRMNRFMSRLKLKARKRLSA
jgi:preprotein translocase subunit Sec63